MSPRISLPGADELFRTTSPRPPYEPADSPAGRAAAPAPAGEATEDTQPAASGAARSASGRTRSARRGPGERASTGRERHEEKITVYVSAAELVDLERARLTLRAEHGIAVDRGRIVREALSVLLADLDGKHGDSILVRRLAGL